MGFDRQSSTLLLLIRSGPLPSRLNANAKKSGSIGNSPILICRSQGVRSFWHIACKLQAVNVRTKKPSAKWRYAANDPGLRKDSRIKSPPRSRRFFMGKRRQFSNVTAPPRGSRATLVVSGSAAPGRIARGAYSNRGSYRCTRRSIVLRRDVSDSFGKKQRRLQPDLVRIPSLRVEWQRQS